MIVFIIRTGGGLIERHELFLFAHLREAHRNARQSYSNQDLEGKTLTPLRAKALRAG
jgi:hypothetical protein